MSDVQKTDEVCRQFLSVFIQPAQQVETIPVSEQLFHIPRPSPLSSLQPMTCLAISALSRASLA